MASTSSASTIVDASRLPAYLTGDPSTNILHGNDVLRYPKLAAIVGLQSLSDTMSSKEFWFYVKCTVIHRAILLHTLTFRHDVEEAELSSG